MSWQAGSLSVLTVALAAGFAWYERARPQARVLALVATLAAFAALGRVAFAALPNVKPTTDIVLISGYALGGAPGFAVGALAGLTSNFFFGQGPWTPWQMAAWGAVGVFGAGLAPLTRRGIGRWPLALVCAIVGFAFAAFQDFGDWVTYSDHSLAQLGVYTGKGLGFDAIHAAGCLAFALLFGPALTRSLKRFAARVQVTWQASAAASLAALVLVGMSTAQPARAATPTSYLLSAQNADGGLGAAPGQPSAQLYAGWAALGLAAEGVNPLDVRRGGASLFGYVSTSAPVLSDPGSIERTLLVARAAGAGTSVVGGHAMLAALEREFRRDGSVSEQVNLTSFAVLALRAAGAPVPPRVISWLVRQQNSDGGFSFTTAGGGSDVDDTGAALEALAGTGGSAQRARRRAVAFIERQQDRDGGFPAQDAPGSNAQSTAWAVQGLIAAGIDPGRLHRGGAPAPLEYLQSLIAPDGHIRYSRGSDQTPVWVTAEAMMALAGKPLPIAPAPRRAATVVHRARVGPSGAPRGVRRGRGAAAAPVVRRPHAHARVARARHGAPPDGATMLQLAHAAGVLTALALAPVSLS